MQEGNLETPGAEERGGTAERKVVLLEWRVVAEAEGRKGMGQK